MLFTGAIIHVMYVGIIIIIIIITLQHNAMHVLRDALNKNSTLTKAKKSKLCTFRTRTTNMERTNIIRVKILYKNGSRNNTVNL